METVYDAAGGFDAFLTLAEAWHRRVAADEVVGHAFRHGTHPEHTRRLAAYWAESLGGPRLYSGSIGDGSSVLRMHSGNGEHEEMDRRAVACFDEALKDAGLDADEPLRRTLHAYFEWSTAQMSRYPRSVEDVPARLGVPAWSWDGPVV
ncbi:group II truncated hemoglobin [Arthrobacter sp. NPDC090010]|uniref:group II truncated hemoglobin n=1 Tax=Arthrobacter sp. NPDC090010 TaxID=3363942 RepID=UPI003807AC92